MSITTVQNTPTGASLRVVRESATLGAVNSSRRACTTCVALSAVCDVRACAMRAIHMVVANSEADNVVVAFLAAFEDYQLHKG